MCGASARSVGDEYACRARVCDCDSVHAQEEARVVRVQAEPPRRQAEVSGPSCHAHIRLCEIAANQIERLWRLRGEEQKAFVRRVECLHAALKVKKCGWRA